MSEIELSEARKREFVTLSVRLELDKVQARMEKISVELSLQDSDFSDDYYHKLEEFQKECSNTLDLINLGNVDLAYSKIIFIQAQAVELVLLLEQERENLITMKEYGQKPIKKSPEKLN